MSTPIEFNSSILTTSIILIIMSAVSIALSLLMHLKSRATGKLGKVSATVFSKTFNVFNPHPEHRGIIIANIPFFLIIWLGALTVSWVIATKVLETGTLLGFLTFIICLGFLMIDEVLEIHKKANIFAEAVKDGKGLGNGDVAALSFIKNTLPKLAKYYFSLGIALLIASLTLQYSIPAAIFVLAQIVNVILRFSATVVIFPQIAVLLFTALAVTLQLSASRVKNIMFGFRESEPFSTNDKPFFLMKLYASRTIMHLVTSREPQPEETPEGEKET